MHMYTYKATKLLLLSQKMQEARRDKQVHAIGNWQQLLTSGTSPLAKQKHHPLVNLSLPF